MFLLIEFTFVFFPLFNVCRSSENSSLLCCSRDVPIHLWDAYTGRIFSSFLAENNVNELVSARSIRFMECGRKILAGYEKFLCVFDLSRPGKYGDYLCKYLTFK